MTESASQDMFRLGKVRLRPNLQSVTDSTTALQQLASLAFVSQWKYQWLLPHCGAFHTRVLLGMAEEPGLKCWRRIRMLVWMKTFQRETI